MVDVCEHGRPDHQELIRQLLEALGMGAHARAQTPQAVFEECLTEVEALRSQLAAARDELAEKWELYQACTGAEVYWELTPRIDKLYMQLNAKARGDDTDVEGDPIKPWNNLVSLAVTATARWVAANRWAVNEHQRCEKVDAQLAAAYDVIRRLRERTLDALVASGRAVVDGDPEHYAVVVDPADPFVKYVYGDYESEGPRPPHGYRIVAVEPEVLDAADATPTEAPE